MFLKDNFEKSRQNHEKLPSMQTVNYSNSTVNLCDTAAHKIDKTKILMTTGSLMKVERIAESSLLSILQYFWPIAPDKDWKHLFLA